jgi:hypothetical protein
MDRPRRAAAAKPQGHYAAATSPVKKRKSSATASTSSRKKGKQREQTQVDAMGLPIPTDAAAPIPVITPKPLDPAALALDLDKSYEGQITPPAPPTRPKRQPRWQQPAANPIMFLEDTPIGWNPDEPDLDPEYVFPAISTSMDTDICYIVI